MADPYNPHQKLEDEFAKIEKSHLGPNSGKQWMHLNPFNQTSASINLSDIDLENTRVKVRLPPLVMNNIVQHLERVYNEELGPTDEETVEHPGVLTVRMPPKDPDQLSPAITVICSVVGTIYVKESENPIDLPTAHANTLVITKEGHHTDAPMLPESWDSVIVETPDCDVEVIVRSSSDAPIDIGSVSPPGSLAASREVTPHHSPLSAATNPDITIIPQQSLTSAETPKKKTFEDLWAEQLLPHIEMAERKSREASPQQSPLIVPTEPQTLVISQEPFASTETQKEAMVEEHSLNLDSVVSEAKVTTPQPDSCIVLQEPLAPVEHPTKESLESEIAVSREITSDKSPVVVTAKLETHIVLKESYCSVETQKVKKSPEELSVDNLLPHVELAEETSRTTTPTRSQKQENIEIGVPTDVVEEVQKENKSSKDISPRWKQASQDVRNQIGNINLNSLVGQNKYTGLSPHPTNSAQWMEGTQGSFSKNMKTVPVTEHITSSGDDTRNQDYDGNIEYHTELQSHPILAPLGPKMLSQVNLATINEKIDAYKKQVDAAEYVDKATNDDTKECPIINFEEDLKVTLAKKEKKAAELEELATRKDEKYLAVEKFKIEQADTAAKLKAQQEENRVKNQTWASQWEKMLGVHITAREVKKSDIKVEEVVEKALGATVENIENHFVQKTMQKLEDRDTDIDMTMVDTIEKPGDQDMIIEKFVEDTLGESIEESEKNNIDIENSVQTIAEAELGNPETNIEATAEKIIEEPAKQDVDNENVDEGSAEAFKKSGHSNTSTEENIKKNFESFVENPGEQNRNTKETVEELPQKESECESFCRENPVAFVVKAEYGNEEFNNKLAKEFPKEVAKEQSENDVTEEDQKSMAEEVREVAKKVTKEQSAAGLTEEVQDAKVEKVNAFGAPSALAMRLIKEQAALIEMFVSGADTDMIDLQTTVVNLIKGRLNL